MTQVLPRSFGVPIRADARRRKRDRRRPLEPVIGARVEFWPEEGRIVREWALYFQIHRRGEFRRIAVPLEMARATLEGWLADVREALVTPGLEE